MGFIGYLTKEVLSSIAKERLGDKKPADPLQIECYKAHMAILQARAEFQARCVSVSIQVTTGLAGAVIALVTLFAKPDLQSIFYSEASRCDRPVFGPFDEAILAQGAEEIGFVV